MSIIDQLACSLNRRDEVPNQELAKKIVKAKDKNSVKELVAHLSHKNKNIQGDCIKVLYGIGEAEPALIKDHIEAFTALLDSKNNRMAWGAMMALNHITGEVPGAIYNLLPKLIDAADKGSVITRDNLVRILIKLASQEKYQGKIFPLLIAQITTCPTNQFAMYAEEAAQVVNDSNKQAYIEVLQTRLPLLETESRKNRILKLLKQWKG